MRDRAVEIEEGDGHGAHVTNVRAATIRHNCAAPLATLLPTLPRNDNTSGENAMSDRFRFIPPLVAKAMVIGFLIVLLLVPLGQVESLVGERVGMRQTAAQRVAESWGGVADHGRCAARDSGRDHARRRRTDRGRARDAAHRDRRATCCTCCRTRSRSMPSADLTTRARRSLRNAGLHRARADRRRIRESRLRAPAAGASRAAR